MVGGPFQEKDRKNAQIRIIWLSVMSLVLTMALSPFLTALFAHYFLTDAQFLQFFWTFATIKAVLLCLSIYNLRWRYSITDIVPLPYIVFTYVVYRGVLLIFLNRSKEWISTQISTGGLQLVLTEVLNFLVFEIGVGIVLVALMGFLIPWRLTQHGWRNEHGYETLDEE